MLPSDLADQVAAARAAGGDRDELRRLAVAIRARLRTCPGHVVQEAEAELAPVYEAAFPIPEGSGLDIDHVAELLDAPWFTAARYEAAKRLDAVAGGSPHSWSLADLARIVLGRPRGEARTRAIRGLLHVDRQQRVDTPIVALLHALHAEGTLTVDDVARALRTSQHAFGAGGTGPASEAVRGHADEILWAGTDPSLDSWSPYLPQHTPSGPRFVERGIDMLVGRHPVDPAAWFGKEIPIHMSRAHLTAAELADLAPALAARPEPERHRAFAERFAAGDAEGLLPAYGLEKAAPVLHLVRARQGRPDQRDCDVAEARAVIDAVDPAQAREILVALPEVEPAVLLAALYGWNRPAVEKSFKKHAYTAIAAFGLLPLVEGETLVDRYLALRASAKHGMTFGAERRVKHAATVELALAHLAQANGYPDASELELDLEARIAGDAPDGWDAGDYRITLDADAADLVIVRGGKTLASVPTAIRKTDAYQAARAAQETLREQRRRIRNGLVERLVAAGDPMELATLTRYLAVPAAAGPLRALIWRDATGTTGLLTAADRSEPADRPAPVAGPAPTHHLTTVEGAIHPAQGPLHAVHPIELTPDDLAAWQREIVRRRVVQPVKQAFREVYTPTPAEIEAGVESARFAGHVVNGAVAARLLSARGWRIDARPRELLRRHGDIEAGVHAEVQRYFAEPGSPVVLGTAAFTDKAASNGRGATIRLVDVPARAFSETMRDLDLVVGVAGQGRETGLLERAALLAALVGDLGLDRVTVEGHQAVVRGERATYRVHLGSGSIHVEPGGYLCVVPDSFGAKPARGLFLPFADPDQLTSVVLSKVLLLANDSKITDPTILAQLTRMARPPADLPDGPP